MDEGYIFKKVETEVKTEGGESREKEKLLFAMTSEYLKFRDKGELKKIDLDSIKKMHHGKQPNPDKLRLILEDNSEFSLPEWILDDFDGVMEALAEQSGLKKTKGPEFETGLKEKVLRYSGLGFGVFIIILAIFMLVFGGLIAFLMSPCCFAPFVLVSFISMIWLGNELLKSDKKDKQVWEKD